MVQALDPTSSPSARSSSSGPAARTHFPVLIVGGGTAGICVAARLKNRLHALDVAILDPSEHHDYQPLWTLAGGGVVEKSVSRRSMNSVIPPGVTWLREAAARFEPEHNRVITDSDQAFTYDHLVVAAGIQIEWKLIPGLAEGLGTHGICSNYSYQHVDYTWSTIQSLKSGTAIFTQPGTPVKCGGAPQKICYLADDYFRFRSGVRDQITLKFISGLDNIFAVERYRKTLEEVIERKGIETRYRMELVSIDPGNQVATFQDKDTNGTVEERFDMLHVCPPMSAPDFIKNSPLAAETGWVDVDRASLRHTRYRNVYGIGDASNLPTSKTGAAIRKQAPVLVDHLVADIEGRTSGAAYDGYTSCPLVTGYGKLVMAEFDYDKQPKESFPIDQSKERWSMYQVKRRLLPWLYWNLMLKGKL